MKMAPESQMITIKGKAFLRNKKAIESEIIKRKRKCYLDRFKYLRLGSLGDGSRELHVELLSERDGLVKAVKVPAVNEGDRRLLTWLFFFFSVCVCVYVFKFVVFRVRWSVGGFMCTRRSGRTGKEDGHHDNADTKRTERHRTYNR